MILLDTNVVSEGLRPRPNMTVLAWTDMQPHESLYLCTPVLAELRFGLELLDDSRRKDHLRRGLEKIETDLFLGRILPFDVAAAREYSYLAAERQRSGRRIDLMDGLVAAIARARGAILATRNVGHFGDLGLELINPFETAG
jgi:predicted nucleic acid-binding protein